MNRKNLEDRNQTFWELSCIQSASMGLPVILIGGNLSKTYGASTAILAVFLGNLFLWLIGLVVVSMTTQNRKNAIENVRDYLGKYGSVFAALILMIAFIDWYILQINAATVALGGIFQSYFKWNETGIRLGAALGMLTALLSTGGIFFIKKLCYWLFPFLFLFTIYAFFISGNKASFHVPHLSLAATISVIAVTLPGIVNLPTFFRHSRSKADSFLGLGLMTIFVTLIESFSVIINVAEPFEIFLTNRLNPNFTYLIFTSLFVLCSLVCVNVVNIYFASAGWEAILPHTWHKKEYAIVGLLGTAAYTLLQVSEPMEFLENMANSFISSLGIVLLLTFLVRTIVKHRPRPWEKLVGSFCWLVGCVTAIVMELNTKMNPSEVLVSGIYASALSFLFIIFLEEAFWATKMVVKHDL